MVDKVCHLAVFKLTYRQVKWPLDRLPPTRTCQTTNQRKTAKLASKQKHGMTNVAGYSAATEKEKSIEQWQKKYWPKTFTFLLQLVIFTKNMFNYFIEIANTEVYIEV